MSHSAAIQHLDEMLDSYIRQMEPMYTEIKSLEKNGKSSMKKRNELNRIYKNYKFTKEQKKNIKRMV